MLWAGLAVSGHKPAPSAVAHHPRVIEGATMALASEQAGIGLRRHFTTEGVHPYDDVAWERRDARITNYRDGSVAFEQPGVEVPAGWSLNATNILAQKYFRGTI